MDVLFENYNFTLNENIFGPALAVAVGIEFILSLVSNSFMLIFTFIHYETLKQPAIIFLTNFVFANLLMTLLVMPLTITTASAGEWVFGTTIAQKDGTCQFQGFVFSFGLQLSIWTLAVMSVDRFLFIVKPFLRKRVMTTKVALSVVIFVWIVSGLINVPPYFGLGQYAFGRATATCVQVWDHKDFLAYFCFILLIVTVVITVTTLWTFCFTRNFIKRTHLTSSIPEEINNQQIARQKDLYARQVSKLVGIFGVLLIVTILTFVPAITAGIASIIVGRENLPDALFTVVILSFFVNSFANPVIQAYFRRDMRDFMIRTCQRMMKCCMQRKRRLSNAAALNSQSGDPATARCMALEKI